jgi:hypothetical protein
VFILFTLKDWENIAASAYSTVATFQSPAEWAKALAEFREQFRRIANEKNAEHDAAMDARQMASEAKLLAETLRYSYVVFDPYYKISNSSQCWPSGMRVHRRRPGKNQTMCGVAFKPGGEEEERTLSTPPHHFLKCRVCKSLGGLQEKGDTVLLVNRERRKPRVK